MIDFHKLKSTIILQQTEKYSFRDPAVYFHKGTFYLYYTLVEQTTDEQYFYIGMSKSTDLINWSHPIKLTPRDKTKEYSSPGNILEYGGVYYLCMQTYCRENGEIYGNENSRIYTMATADLEHFEEPVLLAVKDSQAAPEDMGRMIDPYLLRDKDEPDKIWCFYKQNGVSYSYSYDLKHWVYAGHAECGENVCAIIRDDEYLIMHSPENGIGLLRSKDLIHFENIGVTYLAQERWNWAKDRITAGFVLDMTKEPGISGYLLFFHGDNNDNYIFGASLGLAYSKDLIHYDTLDYGNYKLE